MASCAAWFRDCTCGNTLKCLTSIVRWIAVFPLEELKDVTVRVWRVNHWGHLEIDTVLPSLSPEREVHVMIHRGHMRVLREPHNGASADLIRCWAFEDKPLREAVALGWEQYIEGEGSAGPLVSSSASPVSLR